MVCFSQYYLYLLQTRWAFFLLPKIFAHQTFHLGITRSQFVIQIPTVRIMIGKNISDITMFIEIKLDLSRACSPTVCTISSTWGLDFYIFNILILRMWFELKQRPSGLMDKASDFESEDCRFESCLGRFFNFFCRELSQRKFELGIAGKVTELWAKHKTNVHSKDKKETKRKSLPRPGIEPGTFRSSV